MTTLQFGSFSSAVEAPFWHALSQLKIDVLKLDDSLIPISGYYQAGFSLSKSTIAEGTAPVYTPARLCVGPNALEKLDERFSSLPSYSYLAPGLLKNTNTIEEFKALDKNNLLREIGEMIWNDIKSGSALSNPHLLNRFLLLSFADLKKYKFYYWFAFPTLLPPTDCQYTTTSVKPISQAFNNEQAASLTEEIVKYRGNEPIAYKSSAGYFIYKFERNKAIVASLDQWSSFWNTSDNISVAFADPSLTPENPGWPLRNFLFMLKAKWDVKRINVICLRESPGKVDFSTSIVLDVNLPGEIKFDVGPKILGWEKNNQGNLGPRLADLAPLMDPTRLADTAVDLNLKLMKWRLAQSLDLEKISGLKCLLFGAGTLGCYVSRLLMAWGVRNITFIDNGKVSFSNPVRQPLFEFTDCLNGGKPKAQTAAEALKKIFPGVNAKGFDMSIPMPGHPVSAQERSKVESTTKQITELVESHDVLFLLTDSRESRWLPTILGASFGKIVLTTALGFDTYLVMRHGMRISEPNHAVVEEKRSNYTNVNLGCYFCNDVVAPSDSLKDRTLDQQCTVTRPGISALASSSAVEMLVNILNHPRGGWAEAPLKSDPSEPTKSEMGLVPHQIRGFQTHFTSLLVVGQAYEKCTACSEVVLNAYKAGGFEFLYKVFHSSVFLEDLTGLSEMHKETEGTDLDWDDESGDEVLV